jgi:hypothetical protein
MHFRVPDGQESKVGDGDGKATEVSPFGAASIQGSNGKKALKSPREDSGGSHDPPPPPSTSNATQTAMDHKRAFQAVNAETLEVASLNVDYDIPPHKVKAPHALILPLLLPAESSEAMHE